MRIPDECPECGGEVYWFRLNGCDGFQCKNCEFMDVEEFEQFSSPEHEIMLHKALEEKTGLKGGWHKI